MKATTAFCYSRLRAAQRSWATLHAGLHGDVLPALTGRGVLPWGIWSGLFGVGSNELLLLTSGPAGHAAWLRDSLPAEVGAVTEQALLGATLRPTTTDRLTRPGLYVFRFFEIAGADVDEFVRLSGRAWTTFETAVDYQSHPVGLFRPFEIDTPRARMLLCTWYDGLQSWQTSRTPAPDARSNFAARHALTLSTWALATQLVAAES
jgi:hypothetical protein